MLRDHDQERPTAAQLLAKNRTVHYFSYICDLKIGQEYLPDINLLQVFSSNESFVHHLIKFGMQNILNKNKSVICFFTLLTLYIKSRDDSHIVQAVFKHKAYV